MSACTFFGHRDCPERIKPLLQAAITAMIDNGVSVFYVGNEGRFDRMAQTILAELSSTHPQLKYYIVLAYLPDHTGKNETFPLETLYPEDVARTPKRYAISHRNRWMLKHSDLVVTYVTHPGGGAAKFVKYAQNQRKNIISLSSFCIK